MRAASPAITAMTLPPADGPPRRRSRDLSAELVGGSFALYDATTGKVHLLNETAAMVWDLADGSRSVTDIGREVARLFSAEPGAVLADVRRVLRQLRDEGLLEDGKDP